MRRALVLILAAAMACLAPLTMAPAQALVATVSGTLISASEGSAPLEGATVELYTNDSGAPGSLVDVTSTASDGTFSLGAYSGGPKYFVKVTLADYRGGYVGYNFVQEDVANAQKYEAGTDLGEVYMDPAFIKGYVVNPATGKRVSGVRVTVRDQKGETPEAADTTNSRGVFYLYGNQCEDDCKLFFRGNPVNYENGYRACNGGVAPGWGDACASPLGYIGKVKLQHL